MVGVGLIGSTLLNQIQKQAAFLKENRAMEIKVIGLANSRKMYFNDSGIDLKDWKSTLSEKSEDATPVQFVEKMKGFNFSNAIFIDCTASVEVAKTYESILDASISISTPNKIANSSDYAHYLKLKNLARLREVKFSYETNVGAGLPVISTLNDLINSGDRVLKIEGVLSGSLSYIFNNYKKGVLFSDVVKSAKALGFTEPDPRVDLLGYDVRRKVVILARESGLALEAQDVEIEQILPQVCIDAPSVDALFKTLESEHKHFNSLLNGDGNTKLRMIAKIENGKARIGLQNVGVDNPFYHLDGSDNMIVFTTERYRERPLVVTGPGAGAEVTAAGIFAEVITIGNYLG
jgi:aspartokinase/homoserine dehydrogenase 1